MNLILCFIKDPEIIIMDEPGAKFRFLLEEIKLKIH